MDSAILDYIGKKYGCKIDTGYYDRIDEWQAWWRGYYRPFHRYRLLGADSRILERDLFSLRMAKRVCEDWASLLLNERTTVETADVKSGKVLQGEDGLGGILGSTDFWGMGNGLVERAYATGTGAFVLRVNNMKVSSSGTVQSAPDAMIDIAYLDAPNIVPLTVHGDRVKECAFVSRRTERGHKYVYLETHTLDDKGEYIIDNAYFNADSGVLLPADLPNGIAPRIYTGSDLPWFSIVRPNIENNIRGANGLGLSVYANAIDSLKGVDLAYNNFCKDFQLGGKKVFYDRSMTRDVNGKTITPDDMSQSLFMFVGGDVENFDAKTMVQEYNPSLRVEENRVGVQAQLDYLSFKCGLGMRRYQLSGETVKTATEYIGNAQDLAQNISKQNISLEISLKTLFRSLLHLAKTFCGKDVDPTTEITISFDDSVVTDKASERAQDLQDVAAGIMGRYEYRMKYYGEDEETAKGKVAALDDAAAPELTLGD